MKIGIVFSVAMLVLVVVAVFTPGCSFDSWVEINEGDYLTANPGEAHEDPVSSLVKSMTIDRKNNTIRLIIEDSSVISESLITRSRQDWPSGCPANLGSTRMEVLDINVSELTIGELVFSNPVLVRNCPSEPELVLLREDGNIGGGGVACANTVKCIHFKRSL